MTKKKRNHSDKDCWELSGKFNHHHNIAKSRGGTWSKSNIFIWDINIHKAFHFLFGNRTLLEAADLLNYIHEMNEAGFKVDIIDGTTDDFFSNGN